ncbi:MAG: ergothioneine biosynthesis protein EgtB [Cytophagales bacterium]|nr:ergothioneine biosynthesis protein EgtB [Rhizobacter sp.]
MGSVIPSVEQEARRNAAVSGDIRHAGPATLDQALRAGRDQLLTLFDGFERALGPGGLQVAFDPVLNLPLWELGHIGWFEEFWLARNPQRLRGTACDPTVPRSASVLSGADGLYDSSKVPHKQRWLLELPGVQATCDYLVQVRQATLALLAQSGGRDDELYFFRLVLMHEDMHREAWHFMAQQLGIDLGPAMNGRAPKSSSAHGEMQVPGGSYVLGIDGAGFAFDNELRAHPVDLVDFAIDRAPVSWARYLPFIESGGHASESLWTPAGWAWRTRQARSCPLHLRRAEGDWQQHRFGVWVPLDPEAPALHLSAHEAEAWCRWAGRRLPSEAEWETAALRAATDGEPFDWGEVWEWTASPFMPYAGFEPHPYRDYSQPWFDGRPVLRGASFATSPRLKHPCYRNFFPADRADVFAGFRTCAP